MAPAIPIVHVSELEQKVNQLPHGKTRKPHIQLAQCDRKEMVQYKCNVQRPKAKGEQPTIICEPVVRFYRQYVRVACLGMRVVTGQLLTAVIGVRTAYWPRLRGGSNGMRK